MTFSYSRLRRYQDCPRAYYLHYVKELPDEASIAMRLGSLVHEALERFYRWVVLEEYAGILPHTVLFSIYREVFGESRVADPDVYADGRGILSKYVESHPNVDHMSVLAIEQEFRMEIGGAEVLGYIDRVDRVDGGIRVVDYKTNRLLFERSEVESDMQMSIYAIAAKRLYPMAERVYLTLDMLRHEIPLDTERTGEQLEATAEYISVLVGRATKDVEFEPVVGPGCVYCGQQKNCPAFQGVLRGEVPPPSESARLMLNVDELAAERERVAGLAKIYYSKQRELDSLLKKRIDEEGTVTAGGRVYDLVRYASETRYGVDAVSAIGIAANVPASEAYKRLMVVDKKEVDRWMKELKGQLDESALLLLGAELEAMAEKKWTQRLQSRKEGR